MSELMCMYDNSVVIDWTKETKNEGVYHYNPHRQQWFRCLAADVPADVDCCPHCGSEAGIMAWHWIDGEWLRECEMGWEWIMKDHQIRLQRLGMELWLCLHCGEAVT